MAECVFHFNSIKCNLGPCGTFGGLEMTYKVEDVVWILENKDQYDSGGEGYGMFEYTLKVCRCGCLRCILPCHTGAQSHSNPTRGISTPPPLVISTPLQPPPPGGGEPSRHWWGDYKGGGEVIRLSCPRH